MALLPALVSTSTGRELAEMALAFAAEKGDELLAVGITLQCFCTMWDRFYQLATSTDLSPAAAEADVAIRHIRQKYTNTQDFCELTSSAWPHAALVHYAGRVSTLLQVVQETTVIHNRIVEEWAPPPGITPRLHPAYDTHQIFLLKYYALAWVVVDQLLVREETRNEARPLQDALMELVRRISEEMSSTEE